MITPEEYSYIHGYVKAAIDKHTREAIITSLIMFAIAIALGVVLTAVFLLLQH